MFDSYATGLIAYAAQVDELLSLHRGTDTIDKPLLWAGSFTSQILTALTEDDDELRDRAFPDWEADDEEIDADTIRDGILERIRDDIVCELPATSAAPATPTANSSPRAYRRSCRGSPAATTSPEPSSKAHSAGCAILGTLPTFGPRPPARGGSPIPSRRHCRTAKRSTP